MEVRPNEDLHMARRGQSLLAQPRQYDETSPFYLRLGRDHAIFAARKQSQQAMMIGTNPNGAMSSRAKVKDHATWYADGAAKEDATVETVQGALKCSEHRYGGGVAVQPPLEVSWATWRTDSVTSGTTGNKS